MNQALVNTFIDFKKSYFDTFNEEFMPAEGSFDFVERQSLPQDFVDFVRESTKCLDKTKYFTNYVNEDSNEGQNKEFHLKVIELLMIFGLSFCNNDYLDYSTLKSHRSILEEDLLVALDDYDQANNQKKEDDDDDNESKEVSIQEHYFSERFEKTKEFLHKILKSAIFIFNIDGSVKTYCVDNNYLSKSPIILVYSKTRGRILFPTSFRYFSQGLTIKNHLSPRSKNHFYTICEYRLIEDHWIPHTNPEDLKRVSKAIFEFTKNPTKTDSTNTLGDRSDFLSFDFRSFSNLNLIIVGLIGQCDDVFNRMGFNVELVQKHEKNYPDGFCPRNKLHPELVLHITNTKVPQGEQTAVLAYLFLFIPYLDPHWTEPKPASPMSQTYEEATSDAYMRMKISCSQVVILGRSNNVQENQPQQALVDLYFQHYISRSVFIFGRPSKPVKIVEETQKRSSDSFFFGSNDTVNYCEIVDESFDFGDSNNANEGNNSKMTLHEEELEFESLQHFIQWIEWESRVFSISFVLDNFKSAEIRGKMAQNPLLHENAKVFRFHERTEKSRISCEISSEIFSVVRQQMIKNIRFFDEETGKEKKSKAKIIITKVTAYEDGQLEVSLKYEYDSRTTKESKNTYKFFKINQSPSKVAIPGYFSKIAVLYNIESEFVLLNSWYIEERILLTLFYSKLENKVLVIVVHRHFKDRTPPTPIFEIESEYSHQNNSMSRTSEYYSSFHSKTRLLIFTIVERGQSKVVSATLKTDYTGISNMTIKNLDNFIPLEAKDENFLIRQKQNLPNSKQPLCCFPDIPPGDDPQFTDQEVRFTGFTINENGNEALMCFNCYIDLDPKENQNAAEVSKGRFHYLVFFNPLNLTVLKTIKFNDVIFNQNVLDNLTKAIEKQADVERPDLMKRAYESYRGTVKYGISFPFLYVNNSILLLIHYERYEEDEYFPAMTYMIINNIKNYETNNYNDVTDFIFTPNTMTSFDEGSSLFDVAKAIRHFGVIPTSNTLEISRFTNEEYKPDQNSKYNFSPSPIRIFPQKNDFTMNKKELENKHLIKYPRLKSLFMNLLIDCENPYKFQCPDYTGCFDEFSLESVARLVVQTDEKYGRSIIGQLMIPEPNRIPLHLSLINTTSYFDKQNGSLSTKSKVMSDEDKRALISGFQNSDYLHLFALNESKSENATNYLHCSATHFIASLFSTVQTVVSGPIVDSATMSILSYNSKLRKEEHNFEHQMKSAMQLCYTIRSRRFPSFPFLRMTSKKRIFHIGCIGETDSGMSSLLSWLTGNAFPTMSKNTLCIGSNAFPTFKRNYDLFEKNWSIKKDSVKNIINVVGSLFTIEQGTFSQVVGFIAALSACNTIILEFKELSNILKFFRMFFDSADTLCSEFDIKLPKKDDDDDAVVVNDDDEQNAVFEAKIKPYNFLNRRVNVAIFVNMDSDPQSYLDLVKNEVYSLIEERSLNSKTSFAVQAVENINFKFMNNLTSAYEKAVWLKDIGFINVLETRTRTRDVIAPIRNMSLIFGQQVDHEANLSFLSKEISKKKEEEEAIPFVIRDEDSSRQEELYGIADQILKKSLGDSDSKREAQKLLQESKKHGNLKAAIRLIIEQNKTIKEQFENIYNFLDEVIKDGSEEAVYEKLQIMLKEDQYVINQKIMKSNKPNEDEKGLTRDEKLIRLDIETTLDALHKFRDRYVKGEKDQTSKEIICLTDYILEVEEEEKKSIKSDELYICIEIILNGDQDIELIKEYFRNIPENERTNHSINLRMIDLLSKS